MNQFKIVAFIVAVSLVLLCSGISQAADKQPTAAEQQQQLNRAEAEAIVIKAYLQGQIDGWNERLIRIKDARQNLSKAAPKAEKKPVIKPSVKHTGS